MAINALVGRNLFGLTPEESREWREANGLNRTVHLSPTSIELCMRNRVREYREKSLTFEPIGDAVPITQHPTFIFIGEIVAQGRGYKDTTLYRIFSEGGKVVRQFEDRKRMPLRSDADFARYYDHCMALADSIAARGVIDRADPAWGNFIADPNESNINIAIDDVGRSIHYRRGKHRLAIARALALPTVPVAIYSVSGRYVLRHIPRRAAFSRTRLCSAIASSLAQNSRAPAKS